jgi:HD-GYP domain-containing protein (c-di-GMP phosphodiesterase class II)
MPPSCTTASGEQIPLGARLIAVCDPVVVEAFRAVLATPRRHFKALAS